MVADVEGRNEKPRLQSFDGRPGHAAVARDEAAQRAQGPGSERTARERERRVWDQPPPTCMSSKRPSSPTPLPAQPPSASIKMTVDAAAAPSKLLIKRLSARATLPTRGSPFAAGLDLYAWVARISRSAGAWLLASES